MEITINIENKMLYKSILNLLKTMGIKTNTELKVFTKNKQKYPLENTVLKYDQPFESASDINDWTALQ